MSSRDGGPDPFFHPLRLSNCPNKAAQHKAAQHACGQARRHAGPLLQLGSARRHAGVSTCQPEPRASQSSPRSQSSRCLRQMVPRSIGLGQTLDVGRAVQWARWALPRLRRVLRSKRPRAVSCKQLAEQELLFAECVTALVSAAGELQPTQRASFARGACLAGRDAPAPLRAEFSERGG